ncbi:unnamed protein product [Auanema sp. JU1783]|nr:unnamed protein product [Auanema sp. JU1783]
MAYTTVQVPEDWSKEVNPILQSYRTVFTESDANLPTMRVPPAEILTEGAKPIAQKVRPVPLAVRTELQDKLRSMESAGITEKSKSPWASPLVLVRKKVECSPQSRCHEG